MTTDTPNSADSPTTSPAPDAAPFTRKERFSSGLVGTLLTAAGGVSVFLTQNQAGSVTLIGVGAAFLLATVNGSPLTRAKFKDYELEMGRRRLQAVAQAIAAAPEEGRQVLESLASSDPRATRDPAVAQVSAMVYERLVADKLRELLGPGRLKMRGGPGDQGADFTLRTSGTGRLAVVVRNLPEGQRLLHREIHRLASNALAERDEGLLIITSGRLPRDVAEITADLQSQQGKVVRMVRWIDEQDDSALEAVLTAPWV